jgi:peroxiredoxin
MSAPTNAPSLNEGLDEITRSSPAQPMAVLEHGIDQIRRSGVAPGLQVGDPAPDFTLSDQIGRSVHLADLLAQGPVVVVFYRGDWCPYCNLTLHSLQQHLDAIEAAGAKLIAISPQSPDHSLSLAERHELRFSVLSDPDQKTIRAYRLQFTLPPDNQDLFLKPFGNDLRRQNADGTWNLPVPGTFIVVRSGIIGARFVDADFRRRMEPSEIVEALRHLHES